jgi:nuclear pore complex protein Nup54
MNNKGFGSSTNTRFSFGQQNNQTSQNTGFSFGQNNTTTTPSTTTGFSFGQSNQNTNSTFNFGNKSSTGTGLFGSNNTTNTGSSLFGNNNNNNNSLFKTNNTTTGTGLFGANNNNTGTSLFGNNNNNNNTGGLFGSNTTNTGGLFGNNNNKPSLFGSTTTNTGFGGMGQQQQFMGIQQAQQHTSTVADELRKIQEYWNPQSPNCQFKHYFYNMVHPSEVNRYVKPPNDDEGLWRQAQKNNPDSSCMVPAIAIGFDGIKKRMAEQSKQTSAHEAKLKELADKVEKLRQKHLLETTGKLEEYRRRHLSLAHRTLKIMKQVYILRNRGYSIRPEEETLKVRLENLATSLRKSSQFRGRVEELWAHLQMIRDHPGASWYNLASSTTTNMNNNNSNGLNGNINNNINKLSSTGKSNGNLTTTTNNNNLGSNGGNIKSGEMNSQPGRYVVDEEGLQTIHKILTEHQHGLSILTDYVKKNSKEIEDMYRGYHEPGPHYLNIQQNRLDQHYPTTMASTSTLTPLK